MAELIADLSVPAVVAGVLLFGFIKGVNVFDEFVEGAKGGIKTSFDILPALVALITAVGVFSASGALDALTAALAPVAGRLGFPPDTIPLALIRPISGSGALALFEDILSRFGPDSFTGRVASVMQGSTETTFYTIAVYYGAVSVKKSRHTVPAALLADITGFIMSALFVRLLMQ